MNRTLRAAVYFISSTLGSSLATAHAQTAREAPFGYPARPVVVQADDGSTGVVARLQLRDGNVLEFIEVAPGRVAVSERAPWSAPFVSVMAREHFGATPLELFLAVAPPTTAPPAPLLTDHELATRDSTDGTPRDLTTPIAEGIGDPGLEAFECDPFGTNFYNGWLEAFDGVTEYAQAAIAHQFSYESYYFYPGAHIYYGTNNNELTYIGACNGDDDTPFTLTVERRVTESVNGVQMTTWVQSAQVELEHDEKYTFSSNLPLAYRGHITTTQTIEHMGFAVAYDPAPFAFSPN